MGGTYAAVQRKLQWAKDDVHKVGSLIERFEQIEGSPFVIQSHDYVRGKRIIEVTYRAARTHLPTDELAHQIGDAVHNLRATLDYLVYELSVRTKYQGREPANVAPGHLLRATAFPIFLSEEAFDGKKGRGAVPMLAGLTQNQRARIKKLQPFDKPQHPLFVLAELDNLSKHRRVPVFLKVDHIVLDPSEARRFGFSKRESLHKGGRIKDGTRIAVLNQKATWGYGMDTDAQVNMALQREVALVFEKGSPAAGDEVVQTLRRLQTQVSRVVGSFRTDFARRGGGAG